MSEFKKYYVTIASDDKDFIDTIASEVTPSEETIVRTNIDEEQAESFGGRSFSGALFAMKKGKKVRLPGWSPDVFISIQNPDEHSKMTAPYMYVTSRFGCVPWNPTQIELLNENWQIVE